ncbi:hypothetical protein Q7P37_006379 [Cladosporium fusiforme]
MEPAPYTWRAGSGYIPGPHPELQVEVEVEVQHPIIPMAYYNHQYYLYPPPHPAYQVAYAVPPPAYQPAPAPAPASSKKSTSSKKEAPKAAPPPPASEHHSAKNANAPPKLRDGMNYMFPAEHTKLHIFNKSSRVWEDKYKGKTMDFKIFTVSTNFTPGMVIENVISKKGDDAKGWAVTEVVERGDGMWSKGTTIEYGSDKAGGSLSTMGWTGKRGDALPPVWVVVHKI